MDLKIKDVAELLNVSETTIRRWLNEGKIPAYRLHHQYRFSRIEIENWMLSCRLKGESEQEQIYPVKEAESEEGHTRKGMQQFSLYRAIHRGGIIPNMLSESKEEIIRETMKHIGPHLGLDPDGISELLLDRENLMPTALNNGIAVPHTRDFLLKKPYDVVSVVTLRQPVDWGALDGKPVHTLFFLFATNDKRHLHLLAKLAHLSSNDEMIELLRSNVDKDELLEQIKVWEGKVRHLSE